MRARSGARLGYATPRDAVTSGGISHKTSDWAYSAGATSAKISYVFFDPSRSRPYAGIAYNWYTGTLDHDNNAFDLELEYQFQVNAVGGIRALRPLELGGLEPDAVWILLVVADPAVLGGTYEIEIFSLVMGTVPPFAISSLHFPRIDGVVEIN